MKFRRVRDFIEWVMAYSAVKEEAKFWAGQREHRGSLWLKPGMPQHLMEELTDAKFYLYALMVQRDEQRAQLVLALQARNLEDCQEHVSKALLIHDTGNPHGWSVEKINAEAIE